MQATCMTPDRVASCPALLDRPHATLAVSCRGGPCTRCYYSDYTLAGCEGPVCRAHDRPEASGVSPGKRRLARPHVDWKMPRCSTGNALLCQGPGVIASPGILAPPQAIRIGRLRGSQRPLSRMPRPIVESTYLAVERSQCHNSRNSDKHRTLHDTNITTSIKNHESKTNKTTLTTTPTLTPECRHERHKR